LIGFVFFLRFSENIHEKSSKRKSVTIPQLLEKQWDEKTRVIAALVIIILFAASIGSQFIVAGTIINQLFGFPLKVSSAAFGILVIIYTFLGGFKSVTWSDILQMFLILAGMIFLLLPLSLMNHWNDISSLPASHISEFSIPLPTFMVYLLITLFVYYGSQDLFQRIYAPKDSKKAQIGLRIFGVLMILLATVSVILGVVAKAVVPQAQSGEALAALTQEVVPVGLTGLVLAAFISMANSSGDSQLLSLISNIL
jgi:SSS family solute:Na+ symporter